MDTLAALVILLVLALLLKIWRLFDRRTKPPSSRSGDVPIAQFALKPENPNTRAFRRWALSMTCFGEGLIAVLFGAGVLNRTDALWLGFAPLLFIAALWGMKRTTTGVAEFYSTHLVVVTGAGKHVYRWDDIADVQLTTLADDSAANRLFVSMMGVDTDEPFVKLRLRRWLRLAFRSDDRGTDIDGIAAPWPKTMRYYVEDPHGFVAEARGRLQPSLSARP